MRLKFLDDLGVRHFRGAKVSDTAAWPSALALTVGFVYHGFWNLSLEGALWWAQQSWFLPELRVVAGSVEILIAILVWVPRFRFWASLAACVLMVGAMRVHWQEGFSFKQNGYETPLLYALISLQLMVSSRRNSAPI